MCFENIALKSEIEQMEFEFKKESINVKDNSLHHEFFPCDHYFKFDDSEISPGAGYNSEIIQYCLQY